jgi:hypothetical protein
MDMAAQFVAHDAALPEGVERRWWHAVGTTEWRYGLGVDWRLVPYWLTPKGWVMAFGVHKSRIRERQLVTTAESTHLADTRTQTLAQDRLFAGRFVTSATAQLRFAPDAENVPCLDGLTVRAEWRLAGARKRAVQARMLVPMRRRFGLPLPDAAPAQCRQDRSVCLEQEIDPTELGLGQTHPSRHVQWHMAAQQSRLSTRAAAQLLQKLDAIDRTAADNAQAQSEAPNRRAKAVARFVAREGLGGCAFIYRNACGPRPLQLTSHSSSTDSAIKNADGLALKYPQALQPKTPPAAAFARLRQAIGIQGELVAAAKDVQGDPFLRHDDRAILQERLRDAQTKLAGVTAMSDATMQALAQGVHKARKSAARLFWRRGQTRLKKAIDGLLTPLAPLREQVQALEAQYGQQRMPDTYGPLWARAQAIWATQARLLAYKAWLEAADGPLAPQLRATQAQQVEALLARLGNSAGTTGLWAPASLPPSARLQILSQARLSSRRRQVNEQHRRLIRDLDRPGGPCPL